MADDSCPKCGGSLLPEGVFCPHCGVSLGARMDVDVVGDDNIAVVGGENIDIHQGDVHHHGADPQVVADLMKRVEALELSGDGQPAEVDEETQAELDSILADAQDVEDAGHEFDPWDEIGFGNAAKLAGRTNTARRYYARALEDFKESGDPRGEAASLGNLGIIAQERGDLDEAERLQNESLSIFREIGNRQGEADSLGNLGLIAFTRGDLDEAERLHKKSLAIEREIGHREGEATSLNNLGIIAEMRGDHDEAERLFEQSRAIEREMGLLDDEESD